MRRVMPRCLSAGFGSLNFITSFVISKSLEDLNFKFGVNTKYLTTTQYVPNTGVP